MKKQDQEVVTYLRDFARKHLPALGSRDAVILRKPITDFLGVRDSTVRRWLSGGRPPMGLPLLKLRFLLEAAGYELDSLKNFKRAPLLRHGAELLVFGIMTHEEMQKALNFVNSQSVFRIFVTGKTMTRDRIAMLEEVCVRPGKYPFSCTPKSSGYLPLSAWRKTSWVTFLMPNVFSLNYNNEYICR